MRHVRAHGHRPAQPDGHVFSWTLWVLRAEGSSSSSTADHGRRWGRDSRRVPRAVPPWGGWPNLPIKKNIITICLFVAMSLKFHKIRTVPLPLLFPSFSIFLRLLPSRFRLLSPSLCCHASVAPRRGGREPHSHRRARRHPATLTE